MDTVLDPHNLPDTVLDAMGRDVGGFDFAIGRDAPLHIRDGHGSVAAESARGQRAVTAADYARIPAILNAPDAIVSAGVSGVGHPMVRIVKQIDDEKYTAAFELRAGRRTLAAQSLWIGKP